MPARSRRSSSPTRSGVNDYRDVLVLLLERLDDDAKRLGRVESDIVTVGLTARSTDSGSASLAASLHEVLLAVVTDASATLPRAATFPRSNDDRAQYLAKGKELCASIKASPECASGTRRRTPRRSTSSARCSSWSNSMTGLKVSAIYQPGARHLAWRRRLPLVPEGARGACSPAVERWPRTVVQAIELTDKARKIANKVQTGIATAKAAVNTGKKVASGGVGGVVELANGSGLLNAGSNFARSKMEKQLAFFKDQKELAQMKGALGESALMTQALASVPGLGGAERTAHGVARSLPRGREPRYPAAQRRTCNGRVALPKSATVGCLRRRMS